MISTSCAVWSCKGAIDNMTGIKVEISEVSAQISSGVAKDAKGQSILMVVLTKAHSLDLMDFTALIPCDICNSYNSCTYLDRKEKVYCRIDNCCSLIDVRISFLLTAGKEELKSLFTQSSTKNSNVMMQTSDLH